MILVNNYDFNNKRYITRGVNERVPPELQILLWSLIDDRVNDKTINTDYLQVFVITPLGLEMGGIKIEYTQEEPEIVETYEVQNITLYESLKLFVIDDIDHSTMLLAHEY